MKQSIQFWLASGIPLCCLGSISHTQAQIVPDATLPQNSNVTPQGNTSIITEGTRAGSNLFHSFEQFSIPTGSAAYFNNALDIQNIISRVTGSSISNIDGLLQANGTANVFLLNPNGIIFGPNASLSIGGSFLASTASSLNFADGNQFSATAPQATPLLIVSVPLGLQFGGNAKSIQVLGNGQGTRTTTDLIDTTVGLRVQPDQTLALVGGDVALEGGTLNTAGGRIELGSVAGPGLVSLTPIDKGWALGYESISTLGDIQLSGVAAVNASGEGGGDVQVRGRRVTIQDGSQIEVSTLGASPGGTLTVSASESVELSQSSLLSQVAPGATGAGGNLTVETGRLTVQNGAQIGTATFGVGPGGNLAVRASDSVELSQSSFLSAQVAPEATGAGGNLTVETGRLTVQNGAQISTTTFGTGLGGTLALATEQLIVQDGSQIQAATFGVGQAGNLMVSSDAVELVGTSEDGFISSSLTTAVAAPGATGTGGNLTIETGRLSIRGGAQIATATFGVGPGGVLTINASDSIELSGASPTATLLKGSSGLFVSAEPESTGNVGDLRITTGQLIVQDGAKLSADNFGPGQGGTATMNVRQLIVQGGGLVRAGSFGEGPGGILTVNASDSVQVSGTGTIGPDTVNSTLFTQAQETGNAGNLNITTGSVIVQDGAEVTVSSEGTGNAGNLEITALSIYLDNQAALSADTTAGQGNIILRSEDLLVLRRNSNITTNATGTATGGNITIDTDVIAAAEDSDISANAQEAFGGQITINAQAIFGTEFSEVKTLESDITATSDLGPQFSGTVQINTPDVDPSRGLVVLPTNLVDASGLIAQSCRGSGEATASEQSQFIVTGRGGLPPSPSDALSTQAVWQDLRPPARQVANSSSSEVSSLQSDVKRTPDPSSPVVEAQGWVIGPKGQVILTAQAAIANPRGSGLTLVSCQ